MEGGGGDAGGVSRPPSGSEPGVLRSGHAAELCGRGPARLAARVLGE